MEETMVRARKIGGSIGIIIPNDIVERELIFPDDTIKIKVEKTADLNFLWGKWKNIKKTTDKIMKEIDEGEDE